MRKKLFPSVETTLQFERSIRRQGNICATNGVKGLCSEFGESCTVSRESSKGQCSDKGVSEGKRSATEKSVRRRIVCDPTAFVRRSALIVVSGERSNCLSNRIMCLLAQRPCWLVGCLVDWQTEGERRAGDGRATGARGSSQESCWAGERGSRFIDSSPHNDTHSRKIQKAWPIKCYL